MSPYPGDKCHINGNNLWQRARRHTFTEHITYTYNIFHTLSAHFPRFPSFKAWNIHGWFFATPSGKHLNRNVNISIHTVELTPKKGLFVSSPWPVLTTPLSRQIKHIIFVVNSYFFLYGASNKQWSPWSFFFFYVGLCWQCFEEW